MTSPKKKRDVAFYTLHHLTYTNFDVVSDLIWFKMKFDVTSRGITVVYLLTNGKPPLFIVNN